MKELPTAAEASGMGHKLSCAVSRSVAAPEGGA